jgi:hypothetical protein
MVSALHSKLCLVAAFVVRQVLVSSKFVLFKLLPFTENVFLFEWGILMYLFLINELLSLLLMCVSVFVLCWLPHNTVQRYIQ